MGKSSSLKKMSDIRFFLLVLIVAIVIALAVEFVASEEDAVPLGLLVAFVLSVFLTLFRILKKSNEPENRLGGWKYFFAMFGFVAGILSIAMLLVTQEEEAIPVAVLAGLLFSSIMSLVRSIKYSRKEKKAEKERHQQYQEQLQRENRQYVDELKRKEKIISDLRSRNSELQRDYRTNHTQSLSSSSSRYQDDYLEEQRERQKEEDRRKERLEDWYREYVTIEVNFQFHVKDSEYNQDYWDYRSEEIRVSRREAMALIEAGDSAILGKLGYSNWGLIRNFSYKVPYRLYDRPMGC